MDTLNFGILGFGKMGLIRFHSIISMPGCRVKSIFEPNSSCQTPYGVKRCNTPEEIFNDSEIDAVMVCATNDKLCDYTCSALNAGKHVLCEKPPGRNVAELMRMIEAEAKNPRCRLKFGFNHRHHESIQHIRKLIDTQTYGKILWMRGRYGKNVDRNFFSSWRAKKEVAGGGIFLDQGIHMLDIFLFMCRDFDEVSAFVSNCYWNLDVEDNVFAIFRNKEGQVASLHSTMTQWRHLFSLEIFLDRGYLVLNGLKTSSNAYGDEVLTIAKNRSAPPDASWEDEEKLVFPVDNSWGYEIGEFTNCIRGNLPIRTGNSMDALKLMNIVERVYACQK